MDLETRLAQARNAPRSKDAPDYFEIGFDAAAAIAREVVAEKDKQLLDMSAYTAEFNVYREQLVQMTKELAEKDAEIARLKADLQIAKGDF